MRSGGTAMDAARATAEAGVGKGSRQVDQPHGGHLAELQARWHNDPVHRYKRGYVEAG